MSKMRSDELQVMRIRRELDEMLQKNTLNKRRLLELLDKLAMITVDTDLLQRSKIGLTVNSVRKAYSSSRDINQKAVKLIKDWKGLVKSEHGRRKSISSVQSDDGVNSPPGVAAEVQISSPESSSIVSDEVERDQRFSPVLSDKSDGDDDHAYFQQHAPRSLKLARSSSVSSTASTDDTDNGGGSTSGISKPKGDKRKKSVELLHQALLSGDDPPPGAHPEGKLSIDLAIEIEHYIYEDIGNADDRHYAARIRSRITNLRDKNNQTLRNNVLMGKLSTKRVATMSVEQMANDDLKQLRRSIGEESIRNREIVTDTASSRTDMYPCDQCGKRDASYSVTQERVDGDYEPIAITQVVCNGCGHRWRAY